MKKSFLSDYKGNGDIIDQLTKDDDKEQDAPIKTISDVPLPGAALESGFVPKLPLPQSVQEEETGVPVEHMELESSKEGIFQVFKVGDITYRIGGIKPLFVTSLRVNIRASNGSVSYYDSIDLYAARGRASFAQGVYRTWGAVPAKVEQDLIRILEKLEAERDAALLKKPDEQVKTITEADRLLALELLEDPNLFNRIEEDLSSLGYVGEGLNKQLLYLCASSRKLDDPISVMILSQSASGKSLLVDTVKKLMPSEDVVAVTSLSDQALNYIDNLEHKFLVLGEAVHGEVVEYQIREMLSGKELSRMVTVKDEDSGKMQSRIVKTPVIVASVMSGTNHAVNPENASRCFVIHTDESREQTERIHESQRGKYSLERLKHGSEQKKRLVRQHQSAQRLLTKRNIVNDFAPFLDFPTTLMRMRRDHDRFLDLIACVCFLRQYQKKTETDGDLSFIRCDLEDYRIAWKIMVSGVLSSTMRELPTGAQLLYEEIRSFARKAAAEHDLDITQVSMTQRDIREAAVLSQTAVKVGIRQLVDYEYLTVACGGNARSKGFYRLVSDESIKGADLSMIPTPEDMKKRMTTRS
jgi:hypothetical protein